MGLGIGIFRRRLTVGAASLQSLTHPVQEQIAVDAVHRAEVGRMAIGTADVGEHFLAVMSRLAVVCFLGSRQRSDEGRDLIALVERQIHANLLIIGFAQRSGLRMARIAQPKLVGTGILDELGKTWGLRFPAETADAAIG